MKGILLYTQVFGFTPFTFNTTKGKVVASKAWFLYSKFFTISLSTLSIFYLHFNAVLLRISKKFNLFWIVKTFDIYSNCIIMLVSYWIQIHNRNKLIDTMNTAIVIRNNLRYLSPNERIFAKSFCTHFRRVVLILLIQAILFIWYCFESWKTISPSNMYFEFVLTNYYHLGMSIIIVKIFYHTGMMVGVRLYEIVNDRISERLGNIAEQEMKKSEKYLIVTEVDQCVDHLVLIVLKITHLINSVNKLFSTQIMFVLVGCFMCILSSVSTYHECVHRFSESTLKLCAKHRCTDKVKNVILCHFAPDLYICAAVGFKSIVTPTEKSRPAHSSSSPIHSLPFLRYAIDKRSLSYFIIILTILSYRHFAALLYVPRSAVFIACLRTSTTSFSEAFQKNNFLHFGTIQYLRNNRRCDDGGTFFD